MRPALTSANRVDTPTARSLANVENPLILRFLPLTSSYVMSPVTFKLPPIVTIPENAAFPFSKIDTPIPVPAVAPTSNAADGTLVPIPIRPVLLSTKNVVRPTFRSFLNVDTPVTSRPKLPT